MRIYFARNCVAHQDIFPGLFLARREFTNWSALIILWKDIQHLVHRPGRTSIRAFTNSTEPTNSAITSWLKKMQSSKKLRMRRNVDLPTEEEEFVSSVYLLEGKVFSISKESQETIKMLSDQLREALPDTGQRLTDMGRVVDRVQTLMSTNFRDIKSSKKLKEKVKSLRANLRRRITELSKKILPRLEEVDPPKAELSAKITALNEATVELQRLLTDEAALTLILRRDMSEDEKEVDVIRRKDRIEVANSLIQQSRVWVKQYGPGEGIPGGKLLVLGSEGSRGSRCGLRYVSGPIKRG